jgi:hypothetical protein
MVTPGIRTPHSRLHDGGTSAKLAAVIIVASSRSPGVPVVADARNEAGGRWPVQSLALRQRVALQLTATALNHRLDTPECPARESETHRLDLFAQDGEVVVVPEVAGQRVSAALKSLHAVGSHGF